MNLGNHIKCLKLDSKMYFRYIAPKCIRKSVCFLTKKRFIGTENVLVNKFVYSLYLKVDKWMTDYSYSEHTVSDHLGIIDTLGWSRQESKWTGSFSCEMYSTCWINLPFGFVLMREDVSGCGCYSVIASKKNLER